MRPVIRTVIRTALPILTLALIQAPVPAGASAAGTQAFGAARAISVGGHSSCAITPTKRLKCWGLNNDGQLGIGEDLTNQITPVRVPGLRNVQQVSVGDYSTCAVLHGGRLKCWGYNGSGALGDGTTQERHVPTQVKGLTSGVKSVSVGNENACALLVNGTVKCWGYNALGAVGAGTSRVEYHHPVRVLGITNATQMSAGVDFACAVVGGGTLKCWGTNAHGELGDGSTKDRHRPVRVDGVSSGVDRVFAGYYSTCAILPHGKLKCWGDNTYGQIGTGLTGGYFVRPVPVLHMTKGVTSVDVNDGFACAVKDGSAKCWGKSDSYQLGDGTLSAHDVPHQVLRLSTRVTRIALGFNSACALRSSGVEMCWGNNNEGEVGNSSTDLVVPIPKAVHL